MVFVFILRWFSASSRCFFGGVGLMKLSPLVELGSKISSTKSLAKNWAVSFPQKITTTNEATRQYKSPKKKQPTKQLSCRTPTNPSMHWIFLLDAGKYIMKIGMIFFFTQPNPDLSGAGWPQPDPLEEDEIRKAPAPQSYPPPRSKALAAIVFGRDVRCF